MFPNALLLPSRLHRSAANTQLKVQSKTGSAMHPQEVGTQPRGYPVCDLQTPLTVLQKCSLGQTSSPLQSQQCMSFGRPFSNCMSFGHPAHSSASSSTLRRSGMPLKTR
ncbi:uncharacterized protein LOC135373211 isoform X4 [Ornithodoros turicata]|uniref:uncharacterized protein LOC135373211 isoform X4 n=1 Tax=Ornithodoros turicata TaxID=34597 RepID=UPI0031388F16